MGALNICTLFLLVFSALLNYSRSQNFIPQILKSKYSNLGSSSGQNYGSNQGAKTKTVSSSYGGETNFYSESTNDDENNAPSSISINQAHAAQIAKPSSSISKKIHFPNGFGHHSEMAYGSGSLKTKTKSNTKTGRFKSCGTVPPSPMNAGMRCSSFGGCKADCVPDYQFPNGKTQISILCENGKWQVAEEPSWENVPSCQPICLPECQNNGICLAPNQCQCPENFSGPQCQFENKPCLNFPVLPRNSKRLCRGKQCTIECLPGYQFPDGSSISTLQCIKGFWVPGKSQWNSMPDCKATCTPPCLNGGSCLSFNVCQCPQEYRGNQCQYKTDECSAKKMLFNGAYNCSGDMDSFTCSIFCPDGISFEFPPESQYSCFYSSGVFTPSPIPQCVYPSNYNVVSQSSSSHQIHTGNIYSNSYGQGNNQMHLNQFEFPQEEFQIIKQKIYNNQDANKLNIHLPPSVNEIDQLLVVPTITYGANENSVINLVPKPGSCFTWSGTHYKTFDGKIYSFNSKCWHTLIKDAVDNTFSIIIKNSEGCFQKREDNFDCYKIIKIYVQAKQYFLKRDENGNPVFGSSKKILPIPGQQPGMRITMMGDFVVLSMDTVGLTLKWDREQLIHIEVQANLWNRTEGLCGKMDDNEMDDFLNKDGFLSQSVSTLASSWKVEDLEETCNDSPTEEPFYCTNELENKEASAFCTKILSDIRFAACTEVINTVTLLETCKSDYCSCKNADRSICICKTLEVYVKDCIQKGIKDIIYWRDENICPIKCEGGKIYKPCAPKNGQQMCGTVSSYSNNDESCIEGCYCPDGTVLHENKCIAKNQCPCKLRKKNFPPGSSVPKECNTCTCIEGEWDCTQISCGARCAAIGDPHYVTFDGKRYDFMGQCSYYLVKTHNMSIEAENVACAGSISLAMNFPISISSGLPSCTKTVTIRINGQVIKLKQNMDIVVNSMDITKIPYNISGVIIRAVSSIFLLVELPNGIEIWWDGVTRVYVDVPASFKDNTKGLCGTFNNNQKDDFLTPENDIEHSVVPFANKWKTMERCNDIPEVLTNHPCDINLQNKPTAEKYCSKLKSQLFKSCHWFVDPEPYYQDCMYDMCACEYQVSKCLCSTLSAYAAECSRKDVLIEWRNEVRECGIHCAGGQKYQICGNSCTRTCNDLSLRPDCKPQCVEGCNCASGEALNNNGECIPIGQCKCQHDGLEYAAGYKEIRPGVQNLELCTCLNGVWKCYKATENDIKQFPRANHLKAKCDASRNFEFTTCEDVEPVTCKNMHTNEHFSPAVCHAGCQCKKGFVLDSKNKKCVKPEECPCHHGGKSYKEKSRVQSDCNTCTCINGKWNCTTRQCTAECFTWGDSHYKTFDGKYFDYQGQCDFVLAKGSLGSNSFEVTIENVPCGTLGTSCAKSLTLRITAGEDIESFTLTKEKKIQKFIAKKHFTIRDKGLFIIMEAADLGLVVQWDKGTRIYVKVDPQWKARIKGLCGNYNDNSDDDFQTPSGGISEVSARVFGDSWRLQNYCPEALELTDTCSENPERRVWAVKKCGLLKSSLFAPCHSEVPLEKYLDRCIFDACACDQGDDCQCLCTALSAYAQECNSKGVPVKWRSQNFCPLECDESCSKYSPCISTCPLETCDNLLTNTKISKLCNEDACIEGCTPKPCPPDHVYLNESFIECVPRNICKTICLEIDGLTYYEGDLMEEDECHSCYCSRGEKICKGQPCSTTELPIISTTLQHEQNIQCSDGWTSWINQDKASEGKETIKLSDIEPIPTAIILNNLISSSKCDISDMVNIECLTENGTHYKEVGLDVECSLERGLNCKSDDAAAPCPDFKIRVFCECIHTTTLLPEKPTTELSKCPPGMIEDNCAIECDKLCAYYLFMVREKGLCSEGTSCESGCISAEKKLNCPKGHYWLNENTCVAKQDCMCISDNDKPVRPGQVIKEDECRVCQCIENSFSCNDDQKCIKGEIQDLNYSLKLEETTTVISTTTAYLTPSVSPPPTCSENRYINLVQGDQPLPDDAFSASSTLSETFSPSDAKIESIVTKTSGGSWAPQTTDQNQYLEINFGRQEAVYGIIIKGSPLYDEYVTSYRVMYTPDEGSTFYYVLNQENPPRPQIFRGSVDSFLPIKQIFSTPIEATRIRINPQTWNNAISLRVEIIGCSEEVPTTTPSYYDYLTSEKVKVALCDDEMGLGNEQLVDQQISVSSEISAEFSKQHVRLNSDSAWQPLTNSVTEWVQIDFLESRDLTAIVTKGGKNGWVTAFTVKYSQNEKDWNPILNANGQAEKIFLGNFDNVAPAVNNFNLPINARYLRIIPTKWHKTIQLRLEIRGCFKPYPHLEIPSTTTETNFPCNHCPGILQGDTMEMEACRCLSNLWYDGIKCVNRTQCPCMVGHISYEVGSVFEKEDCSECLCKLGGISHCTPKRCGPCKEELKSTVTSTCHCTCQPCPENTILCPRSNVCINSTLWCNGVQDCPDDEINCEIFTTPSIPTDKPKTCPLIECQAGFKKIIDQPSNNNEQSQKNAYFTPMLSDTGLTKTKQSVSYKSPNYYSKTNHSKYHLAKPETSLLKEVVEEIICPEVKCVIDRPSSVYRHLIEECPKVICPINFIPKIENNGDPNAKTCPTYSCYPQPLPDAICNITGRTFNTLDGTEYKYDICNHVIARDLAQDEWMVLLKKNCSKECSRDLVINHFQDQITIRSDLSVNYDDYEYTIEQIKNLGSDKGFAISQLGSTVLFVSQKYGFWIVWNKLANVKLGIAHKLVGKVDGLCGFFNDITEDDKRKPDGSLSRTTADFGDSWALNNKQEQPSAWCEAKACPIKIQNNAWTICNRVKEQPLSECAKTIDIEAFVSRCLDSTCNCLEKAEGNHTAEEECRCNAMQTFVVDCLSTDDKIDLSDWRMQHDCPASCETPLVYHDCYNRKCEPTCESIGDPYVCPKVAKMCFPGCYCPAGYVKKGNNCIKPSSCRDCECNLLPHLQYVTYDNNNFTVNGNCVYVMSRDVLPENTDSHKWQVLITNHPCKNKPEKTCVGKITILYQGYKIHILVDNYRNKLKLIVDNERIADYEEIEDWASVRETGAKHMKMLLTEVQVEVSVYFPSLGVSVKAPSHKYGGKLEGLCGDCNKNPDDDIKYGAFSGIKLQGKPKDVNDFALSWLYENLPGGQTREECENKPEEKCIELPPEEDPCSQLLDEKKFGQCLNVMDPSLFIDWCKKDTCGKKLELSCSAIEAYAKDCASTGFCVNWRNEHCPAPACPSDQHFQQCANLAQETCADFKAKSEKNKMINNTPKSITSALMEGCYCPEGKVLLNDTCVIPKNCEVCDNEGHHPGDLWKKDKCTTCRCEGTSLKCETQYCPGKETICERGFNAIKLPTSEEEICCDKYACVPEPTAGPTCEPPQKLICASDQALKLDTKPNGCQTFICECKPKDECESVDLINKSKTLEPGYVLEIDENGCCPIAKQICKKETCPASQDCPQYFSLKTEENPEKCCSKYSCIPPKEKCIFESTYTFAETGGEKLLTKYEKQKMLKNLNETWQDGPCRDCKCILTNSGNFDSICSTMECTKLENHEDYKEYELKLVPVANKCCPEIKRVACKFENKLHKIGEEWTSDGDYCTTYKCIETDKVRKEISITNCPDKKCKLGYQYEAASEKSKECCGKCIQIACIEGDKNIREVNEKWTSFDYCTNYICVNLNGSFQVESVKVNCPTIAEEDLLNFAFESFPVEGECCEKHKAVGCKVEDKIYKLGDTWPSPDGDKCKTILCATKSNNNNYELIKQESIETCRKNCSKGWEYQESEPECCGECIQTFCVVDNDILKSPNDTWKSEDGCTTYSCDLLGGQLLVSSNHESCPSIVDCPKGNIYKKGCCKYCNATVEEMTLCSPQPIQLKKTVGIIEARKHEHGKCINKNEIRHFTECVGTCHSSTFFNKKTGLHESVCSCCQAIEYQHLDVELECEDGYKWKKRVAIPSRCNCVACGENSLFHENNASLRPFNVKPI